MSDQPQHKDSQTNRAQRYFRRLREGVAVEYSVEACQPVHSRYSECRQCERSCPVNALHVGEEGVQVDDSCLGCGQCAVACPTGALGTPGFALPLIDQALNEPVFVDCWKVPAAHSPKHAVRVPCLGGIALSRLIELRVMAGSRPVVLLDRGWCTSCKSGSDNAHPAARCIDAAHDLLQAMRVPPEQWPAIVARPLPPTQQSQVRSNRSTEQRVSRRAFFGDLAARVTNTASEINPFTSGKQPPEARGHEREPARSRERDRLLSQLRTLSERTGGTMPSSLFPVLNIDQDRCHHHQLCAATCPTGALIPFNNSGVSGMVFDSTACIACGHVEAICPDNSRQFMPQGDGHLPAGAKVVTRIRQRECSGCGRPFEGAAGDMHCPSCSKRTELAGSAFKTLFGRAN